MCDSAFAENQTGFSAVTLIRHIPLRGLGCIVYVLRWINGGCEVCLFRIKIVDVWIESIFNWNGISRVDRYSHVKLGSSIYYVRIAVPQ